MSLKRFFERNKLVYYIKNVFLDSLPRFLFRMKLDFWIKKQNQYPKEIINNRLNYYCKFNKKISVTDNAIQLKKITKKGNKSMYYYDFMQIARYFKPCLKLNYLFGDIDKNLDKPTFVKSKPIIDSDNSVLLRLDNIRHFNFITDRKSFQDKKNKIVWRGVIHKENRRLLFDLHYGKSNFNIGASRKKNSKQEWIKPFLSIEEQLSYKFILSLEGIDVATNLKWIMSSNSLCFMPKPKFETWYMEGQLIPNFHYVLIKDDYSDIQEKMDFYSEKIDESEKIIKNAKLWTKQFKDKKLEKIVSILVMEKYFLKTQKH